MRHWQRTPGRQKWSSVEIWNEVTPSLSAITNAPQRYTWHENTYFMQIHSPENSPDGLDCFSIIRFGFSWPGHFQPPPLISAPNTLWVIMTYWLLPTCFTGWSNLIWRLGLVRTGIFGLLIHSWMKKGNKVFKMLPSAGSPRLFQIMCAVCYWICIQTLHLWLM